MPAVNNSDHRVTEYNPEAYEAAGQVLDRAAAGFVEIHDQIAAGFLQAYDSLGEPGNPTADEIRKLIDGYRPVQYAVGELPDTLKSASHAVRNTGGAYEEADKGAHRAVVGTDHFPTHVSPTPGAPTHEPSAQPGRRPTTHTPPAA
ncbi:hypothetical protein [Kitasatospora sp. NPDC093102]|uniref:hypothetical protein n=1 Tax=Kitasatospora sp. NPDC093102 TaxID=3155069 RepID=UPI00341A8D8A